MRIIGQTGVKQIYNERHNYDLLVPSLTDNLNKKNRKQMKTCGTVTGITESHNQIIENIIMLPGLDCVTRHNHLVDR